jgi:hypothetical protein
MITLRKSALGHDGVEIFCRDFRAICGCSFEHFLKLFDGHGLTELLGNPL